MFSEEEKSLLHLRLLVSVIHDDLERFHYPGEEAVFEGYQDGRVRCSIGHDTLLVNSEDVTPINEHR